MFDHEGKYGWSKPKDDLLNRRNVKKCKTWTEIADFLVDFKLMILAEETEQHIMDRMFKNIPPEKCPGSFSTGGIFVQPNLFNDYFKSKFLRVKNEIKREIYLGNSLIFCYFNSMLGNI